MLNVAKTHDTVRVVNDQIGTPTYTLDLSRLLVDMIETEFMEFPVFNVADCFITCGCIALMVSLIFINKEFWKDEKKK